jgi:Ca-activated chloride channel family protein
LRHDKCGSQQQQTIILAMDVSGSTRAADIAPDRITASQVAAKTFAKELPRGVRIAAGNRERFLRDLQRDKELTKAQRAKARGKASR